jgi:hypothetical protein
VTSTAVAKDVNVVIRRSSPSGTLRRSGTANPTVGGGLDVLALDDDGRIRTDHQYVG